MVEIQGDFDSFQNAFPFVKKFLTDLGAPAKLWRLISAVILFSTLLVENPDTYGVNGQDGYIRDYHRTQSRIALYMAELGSDHQAGNLPGFTWHN